MLINTILSEFQIDNKTVAVTTDNGTNFVKAFKTYGLQEIPETEEPLVVEDESEEVELTVIEDLELLQLEHFRCACHTLSLVATTDLECLEVVPKNSRKQERPPPNPLSSQLFKRVMRSAFAKCTAFWNMVGRSVKTSEAIKSKIGNSVVRPVPTRWNSTFDSIKFLLKHKSELGIMFEIAETVNLDETEVQFLQEYTAALEPLANALDTLQSEKDFYFGYYAPTILNLYNKLDKIVASEDKFAPVIAWTIKESLKMNKRFKSLLEFDLTAVKTEVIAACTIPLFKLRWVPVEFRDSVKKFFIECLKEFEEAAPSKEINVSSNANEGQKWDALFKDESDVISEETPSTEIQALQFFGKESRDLKLLEDFPNIRKMFMKFNTPIPSSAPSERLFSYGGMILRPKRARLADDIFESVSLLKLNKPYYSV